MPQLLDLNRIVVRNPVAVPVSDAELAGRINARTFHQVRDLRIVRDGGLVIVVGRTPSYYVKQLATHAALELFPGQEIANAIDIAGN
jgi:hypothetical protein